MIRNPITKEQISSLQEEIRPLRNGFDLLGDHVIITDAHANILYANEAVESHTGFSRDEIIGKTPADLWGGFMDKKFYANMWFMIKESKSPFVGEVQNRKKDGTTYWQELRIFPFFGKDGETRFYIGIEPDISRKKVLEGHTRQYIEELEHLNKYLSENKIKVEELAQHLVDAK